MLTQRPLVQRADKTQYMTMRISKETRQEAIEALLLCSQTSLSLWELHKDDRGLAFDPWVLANDMWYVVYQTAIYRSYKDTCLEAAQLLIEGFDPEDDFFRL